jgi:tetratricopeptide (TPR) repeat protein
MIPGLHKLLPIMVVSQYALLAYGESPCDSVYRERAAAFYRQGDLAATIAQLQEAVLSCRGSFYKFMLGNALYRAGKLSESSRAYEAFLESRPNHFEARMCLGFAAFELGDKSKAIDQWTRAARLEPQSPFARAALAVGLYSIQDLDNAGVQYEQAMALDARYAQPEALATDIRWKPPVRAILGDVKHFVQSEAGKR